METACYVLLYTKLYYKDILKLYEVICEYLFEILKHSIWACFQKTCCTVYRQLTDGKLSYDDINVKMISLYCYILLDWI